MLRVQIQWTEVRLTLVVDQRSFQPAKMTNFLSLPPEIRNKIYEHCLVVGEINRDPDWFEQHEDKAQDQDSAERVPNVALLQTNSRINAEGKAILYGHNIFRITGREGLPKESRSRIINISSKDLICQSMNLIRQGKIDFDFRDFPSPEDFKHRRQDFKMMRKAASNSQHLAERSKRTLDMHWTMVDELERRWYDKIEVLRYIELDRLVLNFECCYCSLGCCRLVDSVTDMLTIPFTYEFLIPPAAPEGLVLLGVSEEEDRLIRSMLFTEGKLMCKWTSKLTKATILTISLVSASSSHELDS